MSDQSVSSDNEQRRVELTGLWTTETLSLREADLRSMDWPSSGRVELRAEGVARLDTAGAWLLEEWVSKLRERGLEPTVVGLAGAQLNVLELIREQKETDDVAAATPMPGPLSRLGRALWMPLEENWRLLGFVGETSLTLARLALTPWRFRWRAIAKQIQTTGFDALPIVGLLAFLIGIVISYQGGVQLKTYGANIFIVELVSLTAVRELGPLLAAIVVAGRTGSAFAAQLASMQADDEVDAIRVMGLDPIELLVVPRLLGLLIALPLLSVFSDIMAVFGGMVMSVVLLDVSFRDFAARLPQAVSLTSFAIGIAKTPTFALILGWVGCFQGMSAEKTAQSVGQHTTKSVVQGIFLVIVADAVFSILFSALGI